MKRTRISDRMPSLVGMAKPRYVTHGTTVFEAALDRIRWVFDEFDGRVMVSTSGGKDSTVVVELAAMVARERGQLPLHVMWLDQECEYQSTVDYQQHMYRERDDIEFRWYQIPWLLENNTNHADPWLRVWDPDNEEAWMRPKEPGNPWVENRYGQDSFNILLRAISSEDWDGALLDGLRSDESPARRMATTGVPTYKWTTWSSMDTDPNRPSDKTRWRYRFHPIYDFTTEDVWKAILDNNWEYNKHYNFMFQFGVPTRSMRVSNFHHQGSLSSLLYLQEIEPETWEKATRRLSGLNGYAHLGHDQFPKRLPYMFSTWEEYMNHLIDNLPEREEDSETFRAQYRKVKRVAGDAPDSQVEKLIVRSVIMNDLWGTSIKNFILSWSTQKAIDHHIIEGVKRRRKTA